MFGFHFGSSLWGTCKCTRPGLGSCTGTCWFPLTDWPNALLKLLLSASASSDCSPSVHHFCDNEIDFSLLPQSRQQAAPFCDDECKDWISNRLCCKIERARKNLNSQMDLKLWHQIMMEENGEKEGCFRKLSCLEKRKNELALQETHSWNNTSQVEISCIQFQLVTMTTALLIYSTKASRWVSYKNLPCGCHEIGQSLTNFSD